MATYTGINNLYTKHYADGEISFDYPHGWQIKPGSNPSEIALFEPKPDLKVSVNKQVIPPGYHSPPNFILNTTEAYDSGFRLLSHQVNILNNETTYENTYFIHSKGMIYIQKEVWIPKNGNLYSIIYTYKVKSTNKLPWNQSQDNIIRIYPSDDEDDITANYFDFQSAMQESFSNHGFQIIKESLKINSVIKPGKKEIWADVTIPAINVSWGVRADTVNAYNSVYHYKESFYPAQSGSIGLLGHHTMYSAPFSRIDLLKPGDKVIINDYLTLKKYIYQVESNGDIKWDYKTNPIQFPGGIVDLKLVTCYPPGSTEAAWIVHCKLISIEPL